MNNTLDVLCFNPDLLEFHNLIGTFGFVFILAMSSLIFSFKYKSIRASYKQLWQLMSAFMIFIPGGVIVFSAWMCIKLKPICIEETSISIGGEKYAIEEITRVYIHKEQLGDNLVQIGQAGFFRMLIIDLPNKQYIFGEQHYPIDIMYSELTKTISIE
jgi:hypothetical protein